MTICNLNIFIEFPTILFITVEICYSMLLLLYVLLTFWSILTSYCAVLF